MCVRWEQTAWRGKVSYRHMMQEKAERRRLLEEGSIRKLQSAYRARMARRRTAQLKVSDRMLQSGVVGLLCS